MLGQMHSAARPSSWLQYQYCSVFVCIQALSVGIFPYVLKLLQSSARELRPLLVFIWAKILAVDSVSYVKHSHRLKSFSIIFFKILIVLKLFRASMLKHKVYTVICFSALGNPPQMKKNTCLLTCIAILYIHLNCFGGDHQLSFGSLLSNIIKLDGIMHVVLKNVHFCFWSELSFWSKMFFFWHLIN